MSLNGATWRRQHMETVLRPVSFPRFREYVGESRTQRAQRWRLCYKELSRLQHQWLQATVCWTFAKASGVFDLRTKLQQFENQALARQQLNHFQFNVVADPLEVGIAYSLPGSTKIHNLALHSRSPSKQEQ